MGLFSKLFGQKNQDGKAQSVTDKSFADKQPDVKTYENVVHQIVVSEFLQTNLKLKLKQAFEDPRSFYDENDEFILSDRGLTFPDDTTLTPKFVLIDTLQDQHQMAEIDWKEDEGEIRFAINRIMKVKNYTTVSEELKYDSLDTSEVLAKINDDELKPMDYSLEILDIDSDSYVFTVVPLEKHHEVAALFFKLK